MTTFAELADSGALSFSDGYRTKREELAESGFRVLRVADVQHGRIMLEGNDFVSAEYASQVGAKIAQDGDILLTTKGTIGRVAAVEGLGDERVVYSPQLCFFRVPDQSPVSRSYLRYWFSSPGAVRQISVYSGNTDMAPYLSLRDLRSMRIDLPQPKTQQAIGEVLGALDDKITANRRVLGAARKIVQARVEAAVGDADRHCVGEIAEFLNRKRVPLSKGEREARQGAVPYYGAAGRLDTVDDSLFDEPLVLVGEDGTVITDEGRAVVQYIWGPSWVNNHAHVLRGTTVSTSLLRWLVYRAEVRHLVTGAVQPKISMGNLKTLELAVPGKDVRGALEDECDMFAAQERALSEENETLAKTRDELLPLLMSGKITVKDAEKRVEGVV